MTVQIEGNGSGTRRTAEILAVNLGERGHGHAYGYRIEETPSGFSPGVLVFGRLDDHDRKQPALCLVSEILNAWRENRVQDLDPTSINILQRAAGELAPPRYVPDSSAHFMDVIATVTTQAAEKSKERAAENFE